MKHVMLFAAAVAVLASPAGAAPCRDAKGKYIKCPPPATTPVKKAPCKDTKGKFTKCPAK